MAKNGALYQLQWASSGSRFAGSVLVCQNVRCCAAGYVCTLRMHPVWILAAQWLLPKGLLNKLSPPKALSGFHCRLSTIHTQYTLCDVHNAHSFFCSSFPMSRYLRPPVTVILAGVIPFGAAFIEVFFILSSLWLNKFYYVFGFMAIVFVILTITCAEISVVMIYFQLCYEDYQYHPHHHVLLSHEIPTAPYIVVVCE